MIDGDGRLVEPGSLVEASAGAEREFVEPLLEIKTTPCESTAALRRELYRRIESVLDRADEVGKGLVPLATPTPVRSPNYRPSGRGCRTGSSARTSSTCAAARGHTSTSSNSPGWRSTS
nr:hypothetical protein [Halosimplex aquaticum]